MIGVYPVGNLVRLSSGDIAIVTQTHAPDPHHPQVRIVLDANGARLSDGPLINLWETSEDGYVPPDIVGPADPAEMGIDPLTLL